MLNIPPFLLRFWNIDSSIVYLSLLGVRLLSITDYVLLYKKDILLERFYGALWFLFNNWIKFDWSLFYIWYVFLLNKDNCLFLNSSNTEWVLLKPLIISYLCLSLKEQLLYCFFKCFMLWDFFSLNLLLTEGNSMPSWFVSRNTISRIGFNDNTALSLYFLI